MMEEENKQESGVELRDKDILSGVVETIIFMSENPVSSRKIKELVGGEVSLEDIEKSIESLQKEYEQKHHGITLCQVAQGHQLRTKPIYAKYIPKMFKVRSLMLTSTALEVLAIIAYRQPVSKMEIEKIRGVDSSYIVRGLMEKQLIKVMGKSKELGKPAVYGTTKKFLETFNLAKLEDLPPEYELEEMIGQGIGKPSDIKELTNRNDVERATVDDLQEMDLMEKSIRAISSGTDFTKALVSKEQKGKKTNEGVQSAFEILEEHIDREQVRQANIEASKSEYTPLAKEEMTRSNTIDKSHEDEKELTIPL